MSWLITGSEKNPTDPFRSQVSLLLHGDGANGSTTITDSSPTPKTVTAVGNAQISTAIADPFSNSTGVIAFDGTGDWLTTPASNSFAFGLENFTIEFWVYLLADGKTFSGLLGCGAGVNNSWQVYVNYATTNKRVTFNVFAGNAVATGILATNQWYHIAIVREGIGTNQTKAYTNGTLSGSSTMNYNFLFENISVGRPYFNLDQEYFTGYLDDLRITKGVARYTANFTPPTAPFPDI